MAITRSIIRIYNDETLQTLVQTVTTNSDADSIDVSQLTQGNEYFATVQVTDNGSESEESAPYRFYTLPEVYFEDAPLASGTSIHFWTIVDTYEVGILRNGVVYREQDTDSREVYVYSDEVNYRGDIWNLQPNTTYVLTPFVMDEFGRIWRNTDDIAIVRTTSQVPSVSISYLHPTSTTITGNVTVTSDVAIDDLEVKLLPQGGGNYITATGYTAQNGTQQFTATGLNPNTTYTIYATATNVGGSATDTANFTTLSVSATVSLDSIALNIDYPTDSVDVEASGSVDAGGVIDTVGVVFFTTNSTADTPVGEASGAQGEDTIQTTASPLPSGTTLYAFAYMTYTVGSEGYTVYSDSQTVVTVPVMTFTSQTVQEDSCFGTFSITGNTLDSIVVQYKAPNDLVWHNAAISGNNYSITTLNRGVTYSLRGMATNSGGTYTTPTSTFTPVAAGTCTFTNNSEWSTAQNSYDIIMPYTSTYDIVSATILVADNPSFTNPTTYTAVVSGTDTGTISCRTTNYGYVAGNLYYFKVMAIDSYGTTFTDEHSSTCPTSTPTVTDTGSGLSMTVKRYEVRCTVTNTYALSNMEIKWASDSAMTTNVGTNSQSMSGTSANVSYNITYRIPASGQTIYVQLTAKDVYGNTGILTLSQRVPMDQLTVSSTYTNSGHTYTFTQSVSPTPPPTAIRVNYIQYRIINTGQAGWQTSSQMSALTPVELTFEPNTYDIRGFVQDLYGYTQGSSMYQITVSDPLLKCIVKNGQIECLCYFHPDIEMDTAEIYYDDGQSTKSETIDAKDGTYYITGVSTGTYTLVIKAKDKNGNTYTSNTVEVVVK